MKPTNLYLHSAFQIGEVDPRIFGGFLEHMGRAVYEGVYEPKSKHADEHGCRTDVLDALRKLKMTAMRYPGGNFVSGYHWEDGVGPKEERPTVRELAWKSIETNQFGTNEFMRLSEEMGWTPMMAVNLGTGTPEEARNWVEYCNAAPGTKYADLRVAHGFKKPYNAKLWCLGNEMDGPWQLGHVPAEHYAIRAQQAAKLMRDMDDSLELVAAGSCAKDMPTYIDWDWKVMDYLGDWADYISLHRYVGNEANNTAEYLAVTASIDRQIEDMDAVCRAIQARKRLKKRAYLCFDEWNVWYRARGADQNGRWKPAPHILEEVYNLEDMIVVAGFLNSFIRHADVVKIANIAQIVNVIAPIMTDGDKMLIQSIFYPFMLMSARRDGIALRVGLDGPSYESKSYGEVPVVDSSAILGDGVLHVFASNRSLDEKHRLRIHSLDKEIVSVESAEVVTGPNAKAHNTFTKPNVVTAKPLKRVQIRDGVVQCNLPPMSFAAFTLRVK